MKNKIFYVIVLLLASCNLYANGVTSVIISTDLNNITESDSVWLKTQVESKLEANLSKYTNFIIINKTNKNQIIEEQKASEAFTQDSSTSIEVGQLKNANHGIFLTINGNKNIFSLTLRITELSSGITLTTVQSSPREKVEDLYVGKGSAVDEITVYLCENLKIPLTAYEKHILLHGELDLSSKQKITVYENEVEFYRTKITEIDSEIERFNYSENWEYILQKRSYESEKALIEEKLVIAEANLVKAIDEANKRNEEKQKEADHLLEEQNRIVILSSQLHERILDLLSLKTEKSSSLDLLNFIELKKKTYINERDSLNKEIAMLGQRYETIVNNHLDEIYNRPYRTAEMSQGMPAEWAIEARNQEINYYIDNSNANYNKDLEQLKSNINKQLNILMDEIENDYKSLGSFTVNSLSDNLLIYYDEFDASIDGWPMTVVVRDNNIPIITIETSISYKDVTGKKPNYSNYRVLDDIDFYNNLFLRKEPIFIYQLEYKITPFDKSSPSKYEIEVSDLNFYDTNTVKMDDNVIISKKQGVLKVSPKTTELQLDPLYDIRSLEEIEKATEQEYRKQKNNTYKHKTKHHDVSLLYRYTFGDMEVHSFLAQYSYTFNNLFGLHLKLGVGFPEYCSFSFIIKEGKQKTTIDMSPNLKFQFAQYFGIHRIFKFGNFFYINPYLDFGLEVYNSKQDKGYFASSMVVLGLGIGCTIINTFDIFLNIDYNTSAFSTWSNDLFKQNPPLKSLKKENNHYSYGSVQAGVRLKL